MRGVMMHDTGDVRVEDRDDPKIIEPTDAIIEIAASCICGSDMWPYRGLDKITEPRPMGHEYIGTVVEIGSEVRNVRKGQFVIGSFFASDGTCPNCLAGYPSSCMSRVDMCEIGTQAQFARIPWADGTLFALNDSPEAGQIPSVLTVSDVLGTGWFGATAANVRPGATVVVVGDGAVGQCAILAAKHMGAERIIAMSAPGPRQKLALEFGATDVVGERGDEGAARIKDLTNGVGADCVIEAVGTQTSMMQAIKSARVSGHIGYVGVPHGVQLPGQDLFFGHVHLHGGPAPVRRFMPMLSDLVLSGELDPGRVFDLVLPLDRAAEGYAAMDQFVAVKALLTP